ncbi:hypothetical protein DFP72DRAFT_1169864 [Ephemerocybe angulata]|uniref:Uncharacterized protein n=1 Tax=Ephemerocybe angulata TaxID=980116 RepID=A0A8H6HXS3_9AGAR|nr:hypothetical protein DFP72DRAFT_1169864 [Tulosesus angulatus]
MPCQTNKHHAVPEISAAECRRASDSACLDISSDMRWVLRTQTVDPSQTCSGSPSIECPTLDAAEVVLCLNSTGSQTTGSLSAHAALLSPACQIAHLAHPSIRRSTRHAPPFDAFTLPQSQTGTHHLAQLSNLLNATCHGPLRSQPSPPGDDLTPACRCHCTISITRENTPPPRPRSSHSARRAIALRTHSQQGTRKWREDSSWPSAARVLGDKLVLTRLNDHENNSDINSMLAPAVVDPTPSQHPSTMAVHDGRSSNERSRRSDEVNHTSRTPHARPTSKATCTNTTTTTTPANQQTGQPQSIDHTHRRQNLAYCPADEVQGREKLDSWDLKGSCNQTQRQPKPRNSGFGAFEAVPTNNEGDSSVKSSANRARCATTAIRRWEAPTEPRGGWTGRPTNSSPRSAAIWELEQSRPQSNQGIRALRSGICVVRPGEA